VLAVKHLHDSGVVHGDVKPENAMVVLPLNNSSGGRNANDAPLLLKLIDFGCASFLRHSQQGDETAAKLSSSSSLSSSLSTSLSSSSIEDSALRPIVDTYSPPEVFAGRLSAVGTPVDMYRLGATLYTTLQKCPPSHEVSRADRRQGVFSQKYRWRSLSAPCKDLVSRLLSFDPAARPTCAEVLAHPWLSPPRSAKTEEAAKEVGGVTDSGTPLDGAAVRRKRSRGK
jgi:serine/threonine protein kinase